MGWDSLIRRVAVFARRHAWDGFFVLLFAAGVALGGKAIPAGAAMFGAGVFPAMPAEASDQPFHVAQGVAQLPVSALGEPSRYPPAVLFPVANHGQPDWMHQDSGQAAPVSHPVIAICVDDLGEDLAGTDRAMLLPKEVALSFLPYAQSSAFLAEEAEAKGHDVLAHVPMQPLSSDTDPGPMALMVGASDIALRAAWSIDHVPGAIGINNHEGSRFTQDAASLTPVVQLLAARHLFFFDSRTGPNSRVLDVAARFSVKAAARDVFLDDEVSEEAVRRQLDLLALVAKKQGAAIAIGHPHDVTLNVLAQWLAENHGVTLVRLPEAMERKAAAMVAAR